MSETVGKSDDILSAPKIYIRAYSNVRTPLTAVSTVQIGSVQYFTMKTFALLSFSILAAVLSPAVATPMYA